MDSSIRARAAAGAVGAHLGDLSFGVFACHLLVLHVLSRLLGLPDQTGATTLPGLLVQNGVVVVLAFVVSWLLE